jgi:hypothetical protein
MIPVFFIALFGVVFWTVIFLLHKGRHGRATGGIIIVVIVFLDLGRAELFSAPAFDLVTFTALTGQAFDILGVEIDWVRNCFGWKIARLTY